jgi:hypothetical protein
LIDSTYKMVSHSGHHERRWGFREIAESTIENIKQGSFSFGDISYDLGASVEHLKQHTIYYPPDSVLSTWSLTPPSQPSDPSVSNSATDLSILQLSVLEGARHLSRIQPKSENHSRIGVLNFASAKKPGGGFLKGAQAQVGTFILLSSTFIVLPVNFLQEESLARSSTLYPSLMTDTAQQFYRLHKHDPKDGYYSHSMIYSPRVVLFRDDRGNWNEPLEVDILVSAAVNAGLVRRKLRETGSTDESMLEAAMRERMARVLFLFERQGVKDLVLGSFGTGVFRNKVDLVATIWADLLSIDGARFKDSFNRVVFAILDEKTFDEFRETFEKRTEGHRQGHT